MHFNPEITLGAIAEIAVIVIGIFGLAVKIGRMDEKLNLMYRWFERHVVGESRANEGD